MDLQQIAVAFHLLGFAIGLGGATISDVTFFKALRNKILTIQDYGHLATLSRIIWVGLFLLIASGLTIFYLIYSEQGSLPMLSSPRWQTKLTLVGVVLLNGLFFRFLIFPALKNLIAVTLNWSNVGTIAGKLALSGTISILSWYSIFIVTLLPRSFRPPFLYFIGVYLILLIIGFFVSRMVIKNVINK